MRIVEINAVPYGSTMKVMMGIYTIGKDANIDFLLGTGYSYHPIENLPNCYTCFSGFLSKSIHMMLSWITGREGGFSYFSTRSFIKQIKKFHPDVIHLHNLHGSYINIPTLFEFIKANNIPVVWTLHDCWAFTGHCSHFTMVHCDKWKTGCYECPQYNEYPCSLFDNSKKMYRLKQEWFTGVKNLTIVTPSEWLAGLVKQSFLEDYPVKVINNGIDLSVFKPTPSNFREEYGIPKGKFIVLGVAFGWGKRKGLDVFIELSKRLEQDKFQIVLVGTDEKVDKQLPKNIISIHRTQNQTELAEIYTAADLFVNPTREDNYPTVNMEAIACGTPVVTFDTGGSSECIDETCGCVVSCDDIEGLEVEIRKIYVNKPYTAEACLEQARQFERNCRFLEYVELYKTFDK